MKDWEPQGKPVKVKLLSWVLAQSKSQKSKSQGKSQTLEPKVNHNLKQRKHQRNFNQEWCQQ